jgi:hypothetical protein
MTTYTPAWAIEKYLEIREAERADKKEFDGRSRERQGKMELLETFLLGEIHKRGEEQIKTTVGTAYKSPQMRVTMVDRAAVINFVLDCVEKNDLSAFDIFTNHVNKDQVKILLDENIQPPGIEVTRFTACNVRKA